MTDPSTPNDDFPEPQSKTARKREATHAQDLGKKLAALKHEQLEQFDLPDKLSSAITDYQRFPSRGAQRRQLQFIGRLMRDLDLAAIENQLADLEGQSAAARYQFAQLEQWRDRLIDEPDALTGFIEAYPQVDRQQLRQLVKKVRATADEEQRKGPARQLFRFIRDTAQAGELTRTAGS